MANLKVIKRRIQSVKNTQQITKAMKLVAASKLRKAQQAILEARPYAIKMMDVLNHLAARCSSDLHPMFEVREENRHLFLIITSDKGLCGGFNSSIVRKMSQHLKNNGQNENSLIVAGKKGIDIFRNRSVTVQEEIPLWTKDFDYIKAQGIAENLSTLFSEKKFDKVFMVYNEFKSVMQQEVVVEQLLPVVPEELSGKNSAIVVDYIYEPNEEAILADLLKRYMAVEVYRAFLESSASEHGARMTAMDSATRNAGEMIEGLTLTYNKARQAYITKELIEIVNGAEALKG
ncbi:MAG: ATP synthase F1 subunit gamma [Nitrospinae bacterium CG22_combo_CG10-13_8_21_14_all_47_10]|nr:MAG: ATP synthase F1 subunit gamma [Nitrospinae bacterium CG22_combo_CG10-13_8_21_14_all_47_10]